jgi:hypothetical protein
VGESVGLDVVGNWLGRAVDGVDVVGESVGLDVVGNGLGRAVDGVDVVGDSVGLDVVGNGLGRAVVGLDVVGDLLGLAVMGATVEGAGVGTIAPEQGPRTSQACCHVPPYAVAKGSNPTWLHSLSRVGIAAVDLHLKICQFMEASFMDTKLPAT